MNHNIILHNPKHQFNVDGTMLNFLKTYLQNRTQRVVIGGVHYTTVNVNSGGPQGSIIGPILFVLCINDIQSDISPITNSALYADDTKVLRKVDHHTDSVASQKDIDTLYNWSITNQTRFHPDKCKILRVTNQTEKSTLFSHLTVTRIG